MLSLLKLASMEPEPVAVSTGSHDGVFVTTVCCHLTEFDTGLWVSCRACIADAITLWEQLEQSDDERQKAVSKFKINPLKATQVCHIDHLARLVNVHVNKRLSNRQGDTHTHTHTV